ncbi:hypothetical protein [Astrobacterium formosum]|uniref:hypothetical protein n=1 Tax=Astrobacterium formosum TaxID=3069710 RepID=UPI003F4F65C7
MPDLSRRASIVAIAWVGALVVDLVVNKPLGLSPPSIEFKRAHLNDINPAGVASHAGLFGALAQAFSSFLALAVAFVCAPVIAFATGGRLYLARGPHKGCYGNATICCGICEHRFEPEDVALCLAYSEPICSPCCSLDARCHDLPPSSCSRANLHEAHRTLTPERVHDDHMLKPIDVRQLLAKIQRLLKIDWCYEPAAPTDDAAPSFDALAVPPHRHIDDLTHLGQIGYVRGIQAKLAEIESEASNLKPFVECTHGLVGTYDLRRFLAALAGMQCHDAQ